MAKTKTTKVQPLSIDEEMMMWCAYRYAIGRKTYVSSLAPYIAKNYYHRLNDNRMKVASEDIRKCIEDCLRFPTPGFTYEGTVDYKDRNALEDYIIWLNENVTSKEDLYNIEKITCYKEGYGDKYPKKYDVSRKDRKRTHIYDSDIDNLLVWEDLASLFDKANYVKVSTKYNGEENEFIAFPVWRHKYEPCKDNPQFCRSVEFRWEKCYIAVDRYIECGEQSGVINPEYITNIEKYNDKETTTPNT